MEDFLLTLSRRGGAVKSREEVHPVRATPSLVGVQFNMDETQAAAVIQLCFRGYKARKLYNLESLRKVCLPTYVGTGYCSACGTLDSGRLRRYDYCNIKL